MAESVPTIESLNLLNFNIDADGMKARAEELKKEFTAVLDQVAGQDSKNATFANTIVPISDVSTVFENFSGLVSILANTSPKKEIREVGNKVDGELRQYCIDIYTRLDVFNALKGYVENNAEEYNSALTAEQKRLTDRYIRQYKRNGLHLPEEERNKLKELMKQISDKSVKFSTIQNEDNTKIECTREELTGMPKDFIDGLEKVEGSEEKVYVSMKYPEILPVLRSCSNAEVRKRAAIARGKQCMDTNVDLLEEMIDLRHQVAVMLGYTQFSDYELDIVMAKNAANVEKFLTELTARALPKGRKELQRLREFKQKTEGLSELPEIYNWDNAYYTEKLKEAEYTFDKEKVKTYFPTDNVITQMLDIYQELLSLKFEEITGEEKSVWHEEVKLFMVRDRETNEKMGYFYLDLHPREGKYGHAAMFSLIPRGYYKDEMQLPICALVCNFTKGTKDKPSLLYFDEVETFFHEFGHAMHGLCTKVDYSEFSGTNVERDFVETPSQMLENWCWDKKILTRLSKHFEDGSSLPEELSEKMIAAKNFNKGLFILRQLFFGTIDMLVHTLHDSQFTEELKTKYEINWGDLRKLIKRDGYKPDTGALWGELLKIIALQTPIEGTNPIATFGHLAGGYESRYYSYMWADVFCADMFSIFEKEGIMNQELGRRYRDVVLAAGGSRDSQDVLEEFLGREPSQEPFIRMNDL